MFNSGYAYVSSQFRVIVVTDPHTHKHTHTHKQTGPITIHCAAASAQCNKTYGSNFLHLFAFLVSRPPQSALHRQALTLLLNRWLACLTGSSILVLKLTFSPDPFPRNLPPLSL